MSSKLSAKTELTTIANGDLIHVVDISDVTDGTAGTSKKITKANLVTDITASDVSDFDTEVSNNTDVALNTTHRTSDGSDHSFIDQDVSATGTPEFAEINITEGTTTANAVNLGSDISIYRGAWNSLRTNAQLTVEKKLVIVGDGTSLLDGYSVNEKIRLSGGSSGAYDVNLYAESADVLKTDNSFKASNVATDNDVRYIDWRILASNETQTVDTNIGGYFELPFAGTIVSVGAYCDSVGITGTATIDINLSGSTIMTTNKISIESGDLSSRSAATQPVLTTTAVVAGSLIRVDQDAAQTGTIGKGLVVRLGIRQS